MNLMTLHTLVSAGESLSLELKKSTAEKDRACRTLCAFANGQGGQVVFGVTPAGKVVGQTVNDRTLEEQHRSSKDSSRHCSRDFTASPYQGRTRDACACFLQGCTL